MTLNLEETRQNFPSQDSRPSSSEVPFPLDLEIQS